MRPHEITIAAAVSIHDSSPSCKDLIDFGPDRGVLRPQIDEGTFTLAPLKTTQLRPPGYSRGESNE